MKDLIARLESATGPDRELDALIVDVLSAQTTVTAFLAAGLSRREPKPYTASLDAALTLVPAGWWVQHLGQIIGGWAVRVETQGVSIPARTWPLHAPSPALALCIAALKARQA